MIEKVLNSIILKFFRYSLAGFADVKNGNQEQNSKDKYIFGSIFPDCETARHQMEIIGKSKDAR